MELQKEINILSFDGGGTRGVMEVFILKDVMQMATILRDFPKKIFDVVNGYQHESTLFQNENERHSFFDDLHSSATGRIHPSGKFHNSKQVA